MPVYRERGRDGKGQCKTSILLTLSGRVEGGDYEAFPVCTDRNEPTDWRAASPKTVTYVQTRHILSLCFVNGSRSYGPHSMDQKHENNKAVISGRGSSRLRQRGTNKGTRLRSVLCFFWCYVEHETEPISSATVLISFGTICRAPRDTRQNQQDETQPTPLAAPIYRYHEHGHRCLPGPCG